GGDVGLGVLTGRVEQPRALDLQRLAAELAPARHRPHAGAYAPVLGEDLAGVQRPRDTDAGRHELDPRPLALGRGDAVHALEDALDVHVLRLGRLVHRLVVHREVVHDVGVARVVGPVHPLQTVAHDVADLVGVGRVVVDER